jgi:uncharacterized membrane protein YhaH (DUF805 family)
MDWYLMVWRKYAEFDGRSRRSEYWMFVLFNLLVTLGLCVLAGIGFAFLREDGAVAAVSFIPLGLYVLAAIIPSVSVAVRRFHDIGKSGWMLLLLIVLGAIPLLGLIAAVVQLVFLCTDSDPGINQYGPNPKFPELAAGMPAGYAGFPPIGNFAQPPQPPPFPGGSGAAFCTRCGARVNGPSTVCGSCGASI